MNRSGACGYRPRAAHTHIPRGDVGSWEMARRRVASFLRVRALPSAAGPALPVAGAMPPVPAGGAVTPPPLSAPARAQVRIAVRGREEGPLSEREVRRRIAAGRSGPDAPVRKPGMATWMRLRDLHAFADLFARPWIAGGGWSRGPLVMAEVERPIREGRITPDTLVRRKGRSAWKEAAGDPELAARLRAAEPVPQPPHGTTAGKRPLADTPQARREAARARLGVFGFGSVWRAMRDEVGRSLPGEAPEALQWPEVAGRCAHLVDLLVGRERLRDLLEEQLVQHLTVEELRALADFYASPIGRSIGSKMPAVTGAVMPKVMQRVGERIEDPQVQKEIEALQAELERLLGQEDAGSQDEGGMSQAGPPGPGRR